jgi:hypothetical protein
MQRQLTPAERAPAQALSGAPAPRRDPFRLQRQVGNAAVGRLQRQGLDAGVAAPPNERVKVWLNTFIPMSSVGLVEGSTIQVTPDLPYGLTGYARTPQVQWAGDNRDFSEYIHASSRTHQELEFDTVTGAVTLQWKHIGESHLLDPLSSAYIAAATASDAGEVTTLTRRGSVYDVHLVVDATNPLMPGAPAINADVLVTIDPRARTATISGRHDGFPAYEVYVGSSTGTHRLYTYDPRTTGDTPRALFPPMEKTAAAAITY